MSIEIVDFRAFRAGASSADAAKNKVAFECANPSAQRSPIPPRALDEVATSVKAVNPDSDDLITQLAAVAHCGDNQRVKSRRVENSGLGVGAFLGVCVTALAALVFFARTPLSRLIAPSATHGHPATLVSVAKTPVKTDKILARTGPLTRIFHRF